MDRAYGYEHDRGAGPPLLRVYLLGGFRVDRDSGPPLAERWPRPSAQALLKLLAVAPDHRLHREQAIEACWPDADPQAALGSLRVALHAARRALEPELAPRAASSYLTSDGALLRLEPGTVWIDADHAERMARKALEAGDSQGLAGAVDAFTGELLPEDRYAPWVQSRREELADLRDRLRLGLAEALLTEDSTEAAAAAARALLGDSPADERAHQILMSAYLQQGMRRQAVRQYHVCREALDAELGVRPGAETERLHQLALDASGGVWAAPSAVFSPPAALRGLEQVPFQGRGGPLADLLAADAPPVHLVGGEAGLGKTRLVAEVARRHAASGGAVLWGAGHETEGHTPYGAFVEALDGWLADRPASERARIGAEYPELARLLPSLGQVGADVERSPEEERERLFHATAALLRELVTAAPVLLVLDDLHAADAGSFQLLSHLARRTPMVGGGWRFAVTYRTEELSETDPRRAALDALKRQGLARHVELDRLSREECEALAAAVLGLPPGGAVPRRVWEMSLGNPLFALELAREPQHDGPHTPQGVRQLVAARLAGLEPAARRVVDILAVAGGDAALTEVLDVAAEGLHPRLSAAEATDGADAAIAASVLTERDVVAGGRAVPGLAFSHPLVRLTCYEQLSAARRRLLHSAYAEAVLRHRPDAVDTLAVHLTRADDPRATGYLRQAAERAAALCANDTANHYYAELTSLLDSLAAEAAWARIDRSAVLQRMGRYDEAVRVLREALADLRLRGDADGVVLATGRLGEVLARSRAADEGLALIDATPPGPTTSARAAAAHHIGRALLCLVVGRYPEAVAAAERAHACARQVAGPEQRGLLARSLSLQASSLALDGRFAEAGEAADAALPHAEAFGDPQMLGTVLSVQREQARRSGRLPEALRTGRRALDLAERSGDPGSAAFERANLAELHLALEQPDEAAALAQAAVESSLAQPDWSTPYAQVALARVRMRTGLGDPDGLLADALRTARDQGDRQAQSEALSALAELHIRQRRPDQALSLLTQVTGAGTQRLAAWAHLLAGRGERAEALAAAEAARAAAAGERLNETEALIVHAAAVAALGRTGAAAEGFARAEARALALPYPAAARVIALARTLQADDSARAAHGGPQGG